MKKRVLVVAEAANPEWTSVPLIGWSLTNALSHYHSVHLVTQKRNGAAISRTGWLAGKDYTIIDSELIAKPLYRLATVIRGGDKLAWTIATAAGSLAYPYFEYLVWKKFKKALKSGEYDLVHRITPVSPTAPSYLANKLHRLGVPFVVGPINGGVAWPKQFNELQKKEKEWLTKFRVFYKYLPGYRALRKKASAIIGGSMATLEQLPDYTLSRQIYIPENAVDPKKFYPNSERTMRDTINAVFIGRLVPYKGADIAIEAIAKMKNKNRIRYNIIGTGPQLESLKRLISKHMLDDIVKLCGFVDHSDMRKRLKDTDVLVFPSVREFGGGVVLECMALGIVPIVVDYAGPAELVNDSVGYKVPLAAREELIERFTKLLDGVIDNSHHLDKLRNNAIETVQKQFTWEAKVQQITEVYEWVCGDRDAKPEFFNVNRAENPLS